MEVPLNEEARLAKEKSKKLLEQLEHQKKARTLALPTDDRMIKARLRELSEPIMLFAETKAERRERLRKKLVEVGEDRGMPIIGLDNKPITEEQKIIHSSEVQDLQNKLFYFKGKEQLALVRKRIAMYSFDRASKRIQKETEKRNKESQKTNEFSEEDIKTSELFDKLKNISYYTSEIGDIRPLSSCSFNVKGDRIANSSWSGDCKIWNVDTGKLTHHLKGHVERVQHLKWLPKDDLSPTSCNLISCGADNVAYLWPLMKEVDEMETNEVKMISPIGSLKGHNDRLNRIGMHPSGNYCATTSFDCTWRYWDIEKCEELFIQEGHAKAVYGIAFHPDGSLVGTLGLEGVARLWDLRTGKTVLTFEDHVKKGLCIDFSPNGYHFATGAADNSVKIYDIRKKKQVYNIPAHLNMVSNVCFHPENGKYLVSSSFDKTIKIWSTIDYTPLKTLGGHDGRISYVDVSINNCIATVGFDKTIKLAIPPN